MGGKVFSSGSKPLFTPRMAREAYEHIQKSCFDLLNPFFPCIKSPVEAPEKATFGDIDILVSLQDSLFPDEQIRDPQKAGIWEVIEKQLNAIRSYQETPHIKNIAIPWPKTLTESVMSRQLAVEAVAGYKAGPSGDKAGNGKAEPELRYVQVDVHICATDQELEWLCFKSAHGDLWNILGSTIRPFGLTADETALYLRIPEIEFENKKKARIFLTHQPAEALDFLGMSHQNGEWETPFASVDEMFEYAARCRWFILWPREVEDSHPGEEDHEAEAAAAVPAAAAAAAFRDKLKSNDRARMRQRPIFARWVEEFVPSCMATGRCVVDPFADPKRTRASVREEVRALAFATFPGVEDGYNNQLAAWTKEKARIFVKNTLIKKDMCLPDSIAHVLPTPQEGGGRMGDIEKVWRGVLRSALIKIVVEGDESFDGIELPKLRDEKGVLIVDEVKAFIADNWETIGRVAWKENCARAAVAYRIKEERIKQTAEEAADGDM